MEHNLLGVTLSESEDMISQNLEDVGISADWDKISDCLSDIEIQIEFFISNQIGHKAIEEFHDNDDYSFSYWFDYDEKKVLDFIQNVRDSALDDYPYGDSTGYLMENVYDILPKGVFNKIVRDIQKEYGELGGIVLDSCNLEFLIPNEIKQF